MARSRTPLLSFPALFAALAAGPVCAEKWSIDPSLSAITTYTDNVTLASTGSQRSDWVTQVTPGISVTGTGARLRLNAAYGAQFVERARTGDDFFNHFSGSAYAEMLPQLLFIDARGSVTQQSISAFGRQADSNVNVTGNRTTVNSFLVSPYLRRAFGQSADAEARFTLSTLSTRDPNRVADIRNGASDSRATGIDLRLASGPAFKLYTWNIAYSKNNLDYSSTQQPDYSTETITASGRRQITSQVGLLSSLGYEKSDYVAIGQEPRGAFWTLGADWTPTPRTRLAATTGNRYYGRTYSLDFSHRSRRTTWGATYSESITTTHGQALRGSIVPTSGYLDTLFLSSIPDAEARRLAVQNFITQNGLPADMTVPLNFVTTQNMLVKSFNASFGILGASNTVLTNVFASTSDALVAGVPLTGEGDFISSNSVRQTGASALWNWRIATFSSASASASYTRSRSPATGRTDDVQSIRLGVTRQFQPKLSGSLNYRALRSDSNLAGADHSENAVSAALNMRF